MTTTLRTTLAVRLRTTALAVILAATGFLTAAVPGTMPAAPSGFSPFEGIVAIGNDLFAPKAALAAYCASNATFTGYLTASTGSHPAAARITSPNLYAWISNVDSTWSCTAYYRFDGVAWNTTASAGRFDWGLLITSTSVACNYVVNSTDYVKGNATADCPDSDAEYALQATLTAERVYRQDVAHDDIGDLSFVHSDCSSAYGGGDGEALSGGETGWTNPPESFTGGNVGNRPGANCDPLTIDGLGADPAQTITYDKTAPANGTVTINGGATYAVTTAAVLTLSATDNVAGNLDAMRFSNDGTTWGAWQTYETSANWTLAAGDGAKTVSVQYRDKNQNVSGAWSDTITLDTTSPVATLMSPEAGLPVMGDVPVTGVAADATTFQGYTLDYGAGTSPSTWTTIATSTIPVPTAGTLGTWAAGALATGTYTLRLTVRDSAGSAPAVATHQVYVDNTRRGAEPYLASVPFDLGGGWDLGVSVATGEASLSRSLFGIPSYGPPAGLDLAYNSGDTAAAGPLGYGWSSNLTQTLTADGAFRVWKRADGGRVPFGQVAPTWTPLGGHQEKLAAGTGGDAGRYVVTLADQTRLVFEGSGAGRLLRIDNRFGKSLGVDWGTGTATLTDAQGRKTTLTITGTLVTSILDSAGRTWTLGYTASDLISITEPDPDGTGPLAPVTTLTYTAHQLTSITRTRHPASGPADTITWAAEYGGAKVSAVIDPIAYAACMAGGGTATTCRTAAGSVANTFTYGAGTTTVGLLRTYTPARNTSTYTLDGSGRVTERTDPLGAVTRSAWNTPANTLEHVDVPSNSPGDPSTWARTSYTYTTAGNLETEKAGVTVLANGTTTGVATTTRYVYNTSNDVTETHVAYGTPDAAVTIDAYDTAGTGGTPGHLASTTRNGNETTQYAYNASDQLVAERDPKGVVTRHAWTGANETQTVANCTGGATWQTCDASGTHDASTNVTTDVAFNLTTTAGNLGLPERVTTALTGRTTSFGYDELGRTISETSPDGVTGHTWDELGNELTTTPPGVPATTRSLDLMNRVHVEAAPLLTTTTDYDAAGNVVSTTTAGATTTQTHDGNGQLISETVDPGASPHLALTTEHAYDAAGNETATRNPDLTVTRTFYDAMGRVTKTVQNCTSAGTTVWPANDAGWRTCTGSGTVDATWNITTAFGYDDRGNKTSEYLRHSATTGRTTTWSYDDIDRTVKVVDNDVATPSGPTDDVTTEYAFDAAGNQVAVKSPTAAGGTAGYRVTRSFFDALGRVVRVLENCTNATAFTGDAWKTCDGGGTKDAATNVETTFAYDADGNRLSVTAPSPAAASGTDLATVTTRYAYDAAGRLCRVLENATAANPTLTCTSDVTGKTATANMLTEYAYDPRGNLASMTDGNGNTTAYGYDDAGRMASINQPDVANDLTWTYQDNADGTSTKTQTNRGLSAGSVTWTYDGAGRPVSRAYQDAAGLPRTTTYTYTGAGAVWTAADTGSTISITNDRLGRPLGVTVSGDAAATTSYGYSFTAPTRTDASGAYTMTLDKSGRTVRIDDPVHAAEWAFAYGANGELVTTTWPTTTALSTTSSYDGMGRLAGRTTTPGPRATATLAYNRAGQRLTEASTVTGDPSNGTATTGYDPLGRLTAYSLPSLGKTVGATWQAVPNRATLATDGIPATTPFDAANRPTGTGFGADADGRTTARPGQALTWDSLGRLAEVRTSPGNTLVARYTYDALDRLRTVERPGQPTIRFRYAGTSTAVAQVADDATSAAIRNVTVGPEGTVLQDWLGTAQRLYGTNGHHDTTFTTDGAGTVTATLRYDPWGKVLSSTGTLPDWRFQGSWADTSTGLAWSVARWYDPSQGAFASEDTLLGSPEAPASRHLYAYADGDPVGAWDPSGRFPANLSTLERQYCSQGGNLAACYAAYDWSKWARHEREVYFGPNKDADRGNAFQHCAWSLGCALELGERRALTITNNHEQFQAGRFIDNPGAHERDLRRMDLHNNGIGIGMARQSAGYFQAFWNLNEARRVARRQCMAAVRTKLWWLVPTSHYGIYS